MTVDLVQGTDEWLQARVGSLGASCIHEVMAKTKAGPSASRANRLAKLLLERLTGRAEDVYVTKAMQQGRDREPEARNAYVFATDNEVTEVGIFPHPTIKGTHASPDGLVGEDGLIEIKCPEAAEHLETIRLQRIPDKYIQQMLWQMRCSGRRWCDFASYNPDFPEAMQIFIKRVHWDDARINEIEKEVNVFLTELNSKIADLHRIYGSKEAA